MKGILLEVIATSVEDAVAADRGGADRLELVRDLNAGGLTPDVALVEAVIQAVSIPVRVMLRENASMSVGDPAETESLCESARRLSELPIDGIVTGFLRDGAIDMESMTKILSHAPRTRVTFHRAFDEIPDPDGAIQVLKRFPQIDRILTAGGDGTIEERSARVARWQRLATPEITMLFAVGLSWDSIESLGDQKEIREVHTGRAAREPQTVSARVCERRVLALKGTLNPVRRA